jgi:hypothetical protein
MAALTHSWTAIAGPHEDEDLTRRHGAAWSAYRARVRLSGLAGNRRLDRRPLTTSSDRP